MSMTDPIADYLTRIRNALRVQKNKVDVPASRVLKGISSILLEEGFIKNYTEIDDGKQGIIRIYLKYDNNKVSAITGLKRISSPGYRQYANVDQIPRIMNGLGIAILSTSKGILTDRQAKKENIGGEVLCGIW